MPPIGSKGLLIEKFAASILELSDHGLTWNAVVAGRPRLDPTDEIPDCRDAA